MIHAGNLYDKIPLCRLRVELEHILAENNAFSTKKEHLIESLEPSYGPYYQDIIRDLLLAMENI